MDRKELVHRYWLVIVAAVILLLWFTTFEIKGFEDLDHVDVAVEGVFLAAAIIAYLIVQRMEIDVLRAGWGLFTLGLLIDWCDELTHEPDWISVHLEGIITAVGLFIIATGFYIAYLRSKERQERLSSVRDQLMLLNRVLRHDISNHLSVVKGYLQLYRQEPKGDYLDRMDRNVDRVEELIDEVRSSERLISEESDLRPMDLSEAVEGVASLMSGDADIEVDVPPVIVKADGVLGSVVHNLVINAIGHSDREGPSIRITAQEDGEEVEMRIADDGPGISDGMKEKVFQEGFSEGGRGFGLHIVRATMERYGGSVHVEDNSPRGSVFVLRFRKAE
ncbi:MAG: sensor histidine kinase [Methanomassiliicoccales archaeon]